MREIKFRAWDNKNNKMSRPFTMDDIAMAYDCGYYTGLYVDFDVLDESSLRMQYTGLKDKNGVEIYEGDVIELFDHFPYRSPVAWSATDGSWFTRNFSPSEWNQARIIGNIYENPELLGETK